MTDEHIPTLAQERDLERLDQEARERADVMGYVPESNDLLTEAQRRLGDKWMSLAQISVAIAAVAIILLVTYVFNVRS